MKNLFTNKQKKVRKTNGICCGEENGVFLLGEMDETAGGVFLRGKSGMFGGAVQGQGILHSM